MSPWAIFLRPINAREGTRGSFQIALHVFHPVLLEKNFEFFPEGDLPMVLRLPLNVGIRFLNARNSDAERPVALLPLEVPMLLERVANPFRRIAFEELDGLCHRKRGWNREKNMDVVFHATDHQRLHPVLARDAAEIRPEPLLQVPG